MVSVGVGQSPFCSAVVFLGTDGICVCDLQCTSGTACKCLPSSASYGVCVCVLGCRPGRPHLCPTAFRVRERPVETFSQVELKRASSGLKGQL